MNEGQVLLTARRGRARRPPRCRRSISAPAPRRSPHAAAIAPASAAPVLRLEHVNTFYGKSHILNDVTLDVHENEIVALLGRNGAGKSTLLKTLIGIVPAVARHRSVSPATTSPACPRRIARLGIGYVPQGRGLFAGMTRARKSRARPADAPDRGSDGVRLGRGRRSSSISRA